MVFMEVVGGCSTELRRVIHKVALRKQIVYFKIFLKEIGIAIAVAMESPQVLDGYFGGSWGDQRKPKMTYKIPAKNEDLQWKTRPFAIKKPICYDWFFIIIECYFNFFFTSTSWNASIKSYC